MPLDQELRTFIIENFLFGQDDGSPAADDSFIENGIIDSTGVLELVGFLETRYRITVADHELVPANLDTLARLGAFVRRKLEEVTTSRPAITSELDRGGRLAS